MRALLVACALLTAVIPSQVYADGQEPGPSAPASTVLSGVLPGISGLPTPDLAKVIVNPYVLVGYQWVGSNNSYPFDFERVLPFGSVLQVGTMDLTLQGASFWTGTAGVNVVVNPSLTLFASAGGFLPRSFVAPSVLPIELNNVAFPPEIDFTGTNVEYWNAQVGGGFALGCGYSVLVGFLWDHFLMKAEDPRIGSQPLPDQTLRADFRAKTYLPFVGLQTMDKNYRFACMYSPYAALRSTMAIRQSLLAVSESVYTLNKPGQSIIVNGEFDLHPSKTSSLGVWFTGSWMKVKGDAELEFKSASGAVVRNATLENSSLGKYGIAVGLSAGIVF